MLLVLLLLVLVPAAYILGILHRGASLPRWCEALPAMRHALSWRGFAGALALPAAWLLLFYGLVVQVRWSLGRWPRFGESLPGGWPELWFHLTSATGIGLLFSLWGVLPFAAVVLCLPHRQHLAIYAAAYAIAAGLAFGAMFLAPAPFLSWYFD